MNRQQINDMTLHYLIGLLEYRGVVVLRQDEKGYTAETMNREGVATPLMAASSDFNEAVSALVELVAVAEAEAATGHAP